jgi:hypothetical protein
MVGRMDFKSIGVEMHRSSILSHLRLFFQREHVREWARAKIFAPVDRDRNLRCV